MLTGLQTHSSGFGVVIATTGGVASLIGWTVGILTLWPVFSVIVVDPPRT